MSRSSIIITASSLGDLWVAVDAVNKLPKFDGPGEVQAERHVPFFTVPSISSSPIDRSDRWGSMGLSLCIVYALDCPVIDSAQSGGAATPQAPGVDACGASPCPSQ